MYSSKPKTFCSLSKIRHRVHRRRIAPVYTKSALFESPQLASITQKILYKGLLLRFQGEADSSEPFELLHLSHALSLDYVNSFIFGYSATSSFLHRFETIGPWLEHFENRNCEEAFWAQELPELTKVVKSLGIDLLPKSHFVSKQYMESWMLAMCDKADEACSLLQKGELKDPADVPAVYQQVTMAVAEDSPYMHEEIRRREVASELFDHMCMPTISLPTYNTNYSSYSRS